MIVQGKWKAPTILVNGKDGLSPSLARLRRRKTFKVARIIHGEKDKLSVAAAIGLVDTAMAKCSKYILVDIMSSTK